MSGIDAGFARSTICLMLVCFVFCNVLVLISGENEGSGAVIHTTGNIEHVIDLVEVRPEDAVATMYDLDDHHRGYIHNFRMNNTVEDYQNSDEMGIPHINDDTVPVPVENKILIYKEGFPITGVIISLLTFVVLILLVFVFVWIFAKKKSVCVLERRDAQPMYNPLQMEDGGLPKGTVIR